MVVQTVSAQVHELEMALGHPLRKPVGRSAALNEAGHTAFARAEEIFELGQVIPEGECLNFCVRSAERLVHGGGRRCQPSCCSVQWTMWRCRPARWSWRWMRCSQASDGPLFIYAAIGGCFMKTWKQVFAVIVAGASRSHQAARGLCGCACLSVTPGPSWRGGSEPAVLPPSRGASTGCAGRGGATHRATWRTTRPSSDARG
jgi:hypothetical protein